MRRFLVSLVAACLVLAAAPAARAAMITDPAATVSWVPSSGVIVVSTSPSVVPPLGTGAVDFLIFTGGGGLTELVVQNADGDPVIRASGTALDLSFGRIGALLRTDLDTTGLFGPRLALTLAVSGFDPTMVFSGLGELTLETAPPTAGVVPLPAGLPLLAGGLGLLGLLGRRRTA